MQRADAPYREVMTERFEAHPNQIAPAGPALGPTPLMLALLDPPGSLLTGSDTPLTAVLMNTGSEALLVHCGPVIGVLQEDGPGGPAVGGSWGTSLLTDFIDFGLLPGEKRRLTGVTSVRRMTSGPSAPMLPQGPYGLQATLSGTFQRASRRVAEPFSLEGEALQVTVVAGRPE
jgi:hypothetical protein